MRRVDAFLVAGVAALAAFVGLEVARRPVSRAPASDDTLLTPRARAAAQPPAVPARSPLSAANGSPGGQGDVAATVVSSRDPAPQRNLDDIRARIASAADTYIADMLVDTNGQLLRWPDRRERGPRIWVQPMAAVRDWDERYAQMARDAFDDWQRSEANGGLPIRFDFVRDSASADIRVLWTDRFPPEAGQRVGSTRRTNDQYGWIVAADITVAVHDAGGRPIPPEHLAGIMRHEAGHALGLGHSRDPKTKMFPFEVATEIAPADRATLRLLYELPPGPAR